MHTYTYWQNWRIAKPLRGCESLLVLCGQFAALLVLGALGSYGWSFNASANWETPVWMTVLAYGSLLMIGALSVSTAWNPHRASYFLGASVALGAFPEIPKLSFLKDVTHLALIVFVVAHWRGLEMSFRLRSLADQRLRCYALFFFVASVSVGANFLLRGDIWQLKVGFVGLLVLGLLFIAIFEILVSQDSSIFAQLYRGILDSAMIAAMIGGIAIILLVVTPFSMGVAGDGRDTIWGLGYFDRLTLMFNGPGVAGSYFVVAMAVGIHELSRDSGAMKKWKKNGLLLLVNLSPWLTVATGSRVGKIALVVLVLSGLLWKPVRRATLIVIPSALASILVSLDFQSLPNAVQFGLGKIFPDFFDMPTLEKQRLGERFWQLEQRGELLRHSMQVIREAPVVNQLIGMGYGVAGYRTSPYSEPHNQFVGMVVEVGIFGFLSSGSFALICMWQAFAALRNLPRPQKSSAWAFSISLISILGLATSYQITTTGIVLILLLLMLSWSSMGESKSRY